MKALEIFNFEDKEVRIAGTAENPLFIAKDVCEALGYKKGFQNVIKRLDNDEITTGQFVYSGQNRKMLCVTESGLYHLIFKSKMLKAKDFRKWVTSEVLPSIRKTGGYGVERKDVVYIIRNKNSRQNMHRAIMRISNERERLEVYDAVEGHYESLQVSAKGRVYGFNK